MINNQASITTDEVSHAQRGHIQWIWKSQAEPLSSYALKEWRCYSDINTTILEEVYANKKKAKNFPDNYLVSKMEP
jgi:hypothetical protein